MKIFENIDDMCNSERHYTTENKRVFIFIIYMYLCDLLISYYILLLSCGKTKEKKKKRRKKKERTKAKNE